MTKSLSLKIILLFSFTTHLAQAEKVELPESIAAIGDSITAAALAGFRRSDAHNPLLVFKFLYYLGKVGYKGSLYAFEERNRSWATGYSSKVWSHAKRIDSINGEVDLHTYNASVSGSTSYDIQRQVFETMTWSQMHLKQGAPDYVMIAIGANDACTDTNLGMTSTTAYANHLKNAVHSLLNANPDTRILISGVPNLEHLRNVAENSFLGMPPFSTCKDMWKTHHFCDNVLVEKDPEKRLEVTQRLHDYHREIQNLIKDTETRFGKDRVRFSKDVYNYKFSDKEISIDCFHPNVDGQRALADVTWKSTWWK